MLCDMLRELRSLLFPPRCMVCGVSTTPTMQGICPKCRFDIPLTYWWLKDDNPTKSRFDGLIPIVHGSSFFTYKGRSQWAQLIGRFKYGGKWRFAHTLGLWYGSELKASGLYDDIDVIVPVPLHAVKLLKRGYNQSRYLAEGMAEAMGIAVDARSVVRVRNNPSQAKRKANERWHNVDDLFAVRHPERLSNKHILVVDDVLTSGATLYACLSAIHTALPDCRLSVATLAVSEYISAIR